MRSGLIIFLNREAIISDISKARIVTATILISLLVVDMVYRAFSAQSGLLTWYHLVITAFVIFTLLGDRITKIVVSTQEISFEQQVQAFKHDLSSINTLASSGPTADLDELMNEGTDLKHNVWARLVIHRMVMRALLRRVCTENGMGAQLGDVPSLSYMIRRLTEGKVIDQELSISLERIRNTTFVTEWGTGTPPSDSDIQFVLKDGARVLKQVQMLFE